MSELPIRVLRYGKDEPLPEQRVLRAGPLTVLLDGGDLRYVRVGEREILRRVYVAVRDRNWDTIAPRLSDLRVEDHADSFRVTYTCEHRRGEIDFVWNATITGDANGTITYNMAGEARSSFWRNRIGLCVLHPIRECAGAHFVAVKANGSTQAGIFPRDISPHQPVQDLAALLHEVSPGFWAHVRFNGEVFEMEDQRNWTDASFKTYSTPLRLPMPVEVPVGTKIIQSIVLSLQGVAPDQPGAERVSTITIGAAPTSDVPPIGLGVASHGEPLTAREVARLRELHLAHLRVDLRLSDPGYPATLRQAQADAAALGIPLEVALFVTDNGDNELRSLRAAFQESPTKVARWLIFHVSERPTSARWIGAARRHLAAVDHAADFGSGTNADFTELNRARPVVGPLDVVGYAVNPQVHAFDNVSMVETLETQAATVDSAHQFIGGVPIAITPITLKQRFNPAASQPDSAPASAELPRAVDVRQMSLFGAAWTVGSLKYVGESSVASVTYYETTGWRGVLEREDGAPLPAAFRSLPGGAFPLYHVLADIGEFAGGEMIPVRSSRPLQVDGLAVTRDGKLRIIVANLTNMTQRVKLDGVPASVVLKRLDETNAERAMRAPEEFRLAIGDAVSVVDGELERELPPYGIVRIDKT